MRMVLLAAMVLLASCTMADNTTITTSGRIREYTLDNGTYCVALDAGGNDTAMSCDFSRRK